MTHEEALNRLIHRILGQNRNIQKNLSTVTSEHMKAMYQGAEIFNDELVNMITDIRSQLELDSMFIDHNTDQ